MEGDCCDKVNMLETAETLFPWNVPQSGRTKLNYIGARFSPENLRGGKNCSSISKIYEYFMKFELFSTGKLALVVVILEWEVVDSFQNRPVYGEPCRWTTKLPSQDTCKWWWPRDWWDYTMYVNHKLWQDRCINFICNLKPKLPTGSCYYNTCTHVTCKVQTGTYMLA